MPLLAELNLLCQHNLDEIKEGNKLKIGPTKVMEPHFERIRKFRNQVKFRNDRLNRHFLVAYEVHEMTLPNEWEMVLQDYFDEGYRSGYSWMRYVEYTLQYVNFYERWQELKTDLGEKNLNILFNWLYETLDKLPQRFWLFKEEDLERLRKL